VRLAAFRSQCLSLAKNFSIGLRSGEYFGRKKSLAPAARMARRTALPLRAEIVDDDDVGRLERGPEDLLDVLEEALAIDRSIDEPRCSDPIMAQSGQEGHGLPAPVRCLARQPLSAGRPSAKRGHIGLGPGFVDEDHARRVDAVLVGHPLQAAASYVRPVALAGDQRLFLYVSFSLCTKSQTVR